MSNTKTFQLKKYRHNSYAIDTISAGSIEDLHLYLLQHYPDTTMFDVYDTGDVMAGVIATEQKFSSIFFIDEDTADGVSKSLMDFLNPAGDAPNLGVLENENPDPADLINLYLDYVGD